MAATAAGGGWDGAPDTGPATRIATGRGPTAREALLAAGLYLAATLAYLLPFVGDPRGTLGPDLGDPRLSLYLLQWGARQISLGLPDLWNAPFFHPTPGTLAISDHLLGPAAQALALGALGISPPTVYNLLFLSSFALGGLTTWWLLRRAGLGFPGALLGGWLFAFAHGRWDEASHLQILLSQWLPAALLTWDRLLEETRPRRAGPFLCFYALQVTGGVYLAVLLHFGLAALAVAHRRRLGEIARWRPSERATLLATLLLCAALALPFALPYLQRDDALRVPAPRAELRRYGATLASFVTPSLHSPLGRLVGLSPAGHGALFLGFTASALALFGLAATLRRPDSRPVWSSGGRASVATGAAALVLGLILGDLHVRGQRTAALSDRGPSLDYYLAALLVAGGACAAWRALRRAHGGRALLDLPPALPRRLLVIGGVGALLTLPMTLALLHDLAPPLRALRVSHRCFVLALPTIGWLAGRGLELLLARRRPGAVRALVACALFGAVAFELSPRLPPWTPVPARPADFPAYLTYLRDAPDVEGYVELPFTPGWRETERMLLQTWSWRPLVNGYSAITPPSYWEIGELFDPMPDGRGRRRLLELGVTHLVVHRDAERAGLRRRIQHWIDAASWAGEITSVFENGPILVLRLEPPSDLGARRAAAAPSPRTGP